LQTTGMTVQMSSLSQPGGTEVRCQYSE
jgi:hypothetical protein